MEKPTYKTDRHTINKAFAQASEALHSGEGGRRQTEPKRCQHPVFLTSCLLLTQVHPGGQKPFVTESHTWIFVINSSLLLSWS